MQLLFWLSIAWVAFAFAGYPAWIWLMANIAARPVARRPFHPRVAIVIVGYNEGARIATKLQSCVEQNYPKDLLRIVFASDGSIDQTVEVAGKFAQLGVEVIPFTQRRGKALCLSEIVARCNEEFLVLTDARQRLHPDAVANLMANFADPEIGAVSGDVVFENENSTEFAEGVSFYWRYERSVRNLEAKSGSAVGVTGALYAIRRECFEPIPAGTILDDVIVPMRAIMKGWRIVFDRSATGYDRPTVEPAQERVRKIRTLAGNFQLLTLLPQVLWPWSNPIFFRFFWHKLARLMVPVFMFTALVANVVLAFDAGAYLALLLLHVTLYLLPVASALWRPIGNLRIVRICIAMLWLNVFVVLGFHAFLRSRRADIWGQTNH